MDDSYFESDINRDLRDIKKKIDILFQVVQKTQETLCQKVELLDSRISKIEDEIGTLQSIQRQVDDIDEELKKFSTIPGNIQQISHNMKILSTSASSSWHRLINTSIRKGDPIPFDPVHSKIL